MLILSENGENMILYFDKNINIIKKNIRKTPYNAIPMLVIAEKEFVSPFLETIFIRFFRFNFIKIYIFLQFSIYDNKKEGFFFS